MTLVTFYLMTALVAGESQKTTPTNTAIMANIITKRTFGEAKNLDIRKCTVAQFPSTRNPIGSALVVLVQCTRSRLYIRTRLISMARLHALLRFHLPPIDQVISLESDNEILS